MFRTGKRLTGVRARAELPRFFPADGRPRLRACLSTSPRRREYKLPVTGIFVPNTTIFEDTLSPTESSIQQCYLLKLPPSRAGAGFSLMSARTEHLPCTVPVRKVAPSRTTPCTSSLKRLSCFEGRTSDRQCIRHTSSRLYPVLSVVVRQLE